MLLVEWRRIWRRNPIISLLAVVILSTGFCIASLTSWILQALSPSSIPGLISQTYVTTAFRSSGGGIQPLSWETVRELLPVTSNNRVGSSIYGPALSARGRANGEVRQLLVASASPGFFQHFVQLETGQDFYGESGGTQDDAQVVVTEHLARTLFTGRRNALEQIIFINGQRFRIVGVANRHFAGLWADTDAWISPYRYVSLDMGGSNQTGAPIDSAKSRSILWQKLPVFYLLSGSSLGTDQLLNSLQNTVQSNPLWSTSLTINEGLTVDPAGDQRVKTWGRVTFFLSVLIIVVASLNYCGLQIADAPRRISEVRLKRTLGASVARIVIDCMFGSSSLVLLSLTLGTASSWIAIRSLSSGATRMIKGSFNIRDIFASLALEVLTSSVVILIVSLLPALRLAKESEAPRTGYGQTASTSTVWTLLGVVSAQIACCILVCLVATTCITTAGNMANHDQGFDSNNLSTIKLGAAEAGKPLEFVTGSNKGYPLSNLTNSILQSPTDIGLEKDSISASSCAPLTDPMKTLTMKRLDQPSSKERYFNYCAVSANFFNVLRNPIIKGTGFSSQQITGEPAEVMVNEKLSRELFKDENPLHQMVHVKQPAWNFEFDAEVVGVTQDMYYSGISRSTEPTIFVPLRGDAFTLAFPLFVTARGPISPRALETFLSRQSGIFMPSTAPVKSYTIARLAQSAAVEQKLRLYLVCTCALLVSVIAYVGLYSVLIHFVNARRKELALRACFGASPWSLRLSVLRQAAYCAIAATVIGLSLWHLTLLRFSAMEWMGGASWSWTISIIISVGCALVSMAIAYFPAESVLRVSPAEILKSQ
jgi:hypothetical protein